MKNQDLAEIFNRFQVENGKYQFIPINIGHINETYRATNGRDSFLFQKINTSIFRRPEVLMNNISVVAKHLEQKSYPKKILKPILTHSDALFSKDKNGGYWRVFPFFENTYSVNVAENLEQVKVASETFAEFMMALSDLDANRIEATIPDFHNGKLRWLQFEEAIARDRVRRRKEILDFIKEVEDYQAIFQEVNQIMESGKLPIRITHNDTKINNLLFDKKTDNPVAVIDWDTIMPNTILSDFGDLMRTFASTMDEESVDFEGIKFRMSVYREICSGFSAYFRNRITDVEKEYLLKGIIWMIYMQVIRFLSDYLDGDNYYKIIYVKQNLNRARNQFYLLKDILRQYSKLEECIDELF